MKKIKEKAKKILCGILVLALTLTGFHGINLVPEAEAAFSSGYTELTFSDWGIVNGKYDAAWGYSAKVGQTALTSLDKVAFTGKIQNGSKSYIRLGSKTDGWEGMEFKGTTGGLSVFSWVNAHYDSVGQTVPYTAKDLSTDEFKLRLTFDFDADNNLTMGVWIDDVFQKNLTYGDGIGASMGCKMLMQATGLTLTDAVREYQEVTFSDWGITDGSYVAGNPYNLSNGLTSLNGVAFTGKIKNSSSSVIILGGKGNAWAGIRIQGRTSGLLFDSEVTNYADDTYTYTVPYTAKDLSTDEFKLRLTFDFDADNNLTMGVWIDDVFQQNLTYGDGIGNKMGCKMLMTAKDLTLTDAVREYQEVTFSDWGITDGNYVVGEIYNLSNGLTSLNGVAFTGKIKNSSSSVIILGGKGNAWAGIRIQGESSYLEFDSEVKGYDGNNYTYRIPYTTKNLGTDEFQLRITFDYDEDGNVVTGVWIDNEFQRYMTFGKMASAFGTKLLMTAEGLVLSDVKTGEESVELTNLTWADFGIDYEAYTESAFRASTTTTSLVNTSFRGKVKFLKKNTASGNYYICYAAKGNAWDGMRIIPNSGGTLTVTALTKNGYDIAFSKILDPNNVEDLDSFLDTPFELGIDMTASGDDLEVSIYINGALYNADPYIWTGAVTSEWAGNNANFIISQSGDSIIAGEKPVLKNITTADFGITYDTFKEGQTYKSSTATAENLLNTSFRGQVLFNKTNEDSSGYYYRICYAAKGYGWDGMNIIPKSNGSLRLLDPNDSSRLDVTLPAPEDIGSFVGTEYELGVDLWAFRDDAKVNIYINGKKLNDTPIVWTDAVKENLVGNNMNFILSAKGDSIVMGVEPPLEQLPSDFMTITANDFGIVDGNDYYNIPTKNLAINGDASLDRKILNMNVAVRGADMQLFYGKSADDEKTGLLFRFTTGSNQIDLLKDGGYTALEKLDGSTGGFDLSGNNLINLKITTEFVGSDVKVGVFINEVLYNNQYITITDYKSSMNATLGVTQYRDGDARMTISTPKQYMPNTFRHLTFNEVDLGAEDYNGQGTSSVAIDWDKLLFSGKVQLKNVGSEIRFGAQGGWVGYRLEMTSGGLALIWDAGSGGNTIFTCPEITADTTFTLTLATEYVDADNDGLLDDLKFGFWINGNMYGNRWFYHVDYQLNESAGSALSFCMGATDGSRTCRLLSWKPNIGTGTSDSGKRVHSLTEGGYLLSGEGTITVNGEVKTSGTVLNTAGDYTIVVTDGSSEYTSTVILWERGDAHPDGKQTVQDLVAIKKVAEGMALSTESGQKGADITKDGSVNVTDVEWMREVLIGTKTLDGAEIPAVSYVAGDTKVMPIAGFWGPTTGTLTDEVYQKIKESGINLVTWSIDTYGVGDETANVLKQLELAEKNDISLFVRDSRLNNESTADDIAAKIADYSQYASFRGLTIVDEPGASDGTYGSTERALNNYAALSKNIDSFANLNAYTNLLPLDTSVGTEANYKAYLGEYCSTYNPKVLSYDNYPFNNYTVKNCSNYFKNLSIIRDKAAEYKIPFWTFVQAGAWGSKTTITEAQMKWNLNMNLAFGAKGIQYFPMVEPTGYSTYDGKGMITESGETTEYYTYIKNLNQWIATVDDVLMNSESKGIMTTGYYANKNIKENGITTVDTYGKVSSIATNETAAFNPTNGAVAGCFDYNGKTAVYVVNYDVSKAHTITLGLTDVTNYRVLKNDGETDASGTSCAISLGAGEAALVVLD